MNETPNSPKRRHILSSINPESRPEKKRSRHRSRSPRADTHDTARDQKEKDNPQDEDPNAPRRSRLKLKDGKSSRRRRHRSRSRSRSRDRRHDHGESSSSHRRHHHHHRRRRRSRSPTPTNPFEEEPLDPETAFRESLFDAMADYEGASYWEGVYGQPVHIYGNEKTGPQGELERMTDDEYAAHVRQKMWEKTHAGIVEERARREEGRKKKEREERHQRELHEEMEKSLRRGEERRRRKQWASLWTDYDEGWRRWDEGPTVSAIVWPLESGKRGDIDEKSVRTFFVSGMNLEEVGEKAFLARLKDERVRWHPDKIQQKLGGNVDEETMKDVTAVFQIIDRLWSDVRKS